MSSSAENPVEVMARIVEFCESRRLAGTLRPTICCGVNVSIVKSTEFRGLLGNDCAVPEVDEHCVASQSECTRLLNGDRSLVRRWLEKHGWVPGGSDDPSNMWRKTCQGLRPGS